MSKEWLEEARLMAEMLRIETRLPHDFPFDLVDWLIEQAERAQELEEEVDRLNGALHYQLSQENIRNEENRKLKYKNKRYREVINNINEKAMLYGVDEEVYEAIQDATKALEGDLDERN